MKANGPRIERETVIIYNDAEDMAEVWTAANGTFIKLMRSGCQLIEDNQRSATFKIPKRCVTLRGSKPISEKRLKALERARRKRRKPCDAIPLSVQPKNGQKGVLPTGDQL
jgi:hypothetical protein